MYLFDLSLEYICSYTLLINLPYLQSNNVYNDTIIAFKFTTPIIIVTFSTSEIHWILRYCTAQRYPSPLFYI